jgi:hypothetical protein
MWDMGKTESVKFSVSSVVIFFYLILRVSI